MSLPLNNMNLEAGPLTNDGTPNQQNPAQQGTMKEYCKKTC